MTIFFKKIEKKTDFLAIFNSVSGHRRFYYSYSVILYCIILYYIILDCVLLFLCMHISMIFCNVIEVENFYDCMHIFKFNSVWLRFFGHLNRADPCQDCYGALQACIADTPADWRRRPGRPRQSWLRTLETDLRPLNLGLAMAKRRMQDRAAWRRLVATATSTLTSSWKNEAVQHKLVTSLQ